MKINKIATLVFFITFIAMSAIAQTNGVKQQLDDRVSVKFPSTPKILTPGGNTTYAVMDKDSVTYTAMVIDFATVAHLDSAQLAPLKDTQEFADGLKNGIARTAKSFEFGDANIGKWKGYTSYDITGTNAAKKSKIYFQLVIIGSKAYSLACIVPDAVPTKRKDDFFATAELSH